MKKIYTLLMACAVAFAAQAQRPVTYVLDPTVGDVKPFVMNAGDGSEADTSAPAFRPTMRKAAPRAKEYENFTLEDNQYIVAHNTEDEYDSYGSVPYVGETLIGAALPGSMYAKLNNAKAVGIRFCLPTDQEYQGVQYPADEVEVLRVTLHGADVDNIIREATPRSVVKGWNFVRFKTPQELDPEATFISYTYMQTASKTCYGMCNWANLAPNGFWTRVINPNTGKPAWSNFSSQYGAVCIQLIVEADPLADYDFAPTDVDVAPAAVGLESEMAVYFTSNSKKDITSFEYTIQLGDKTVTRTSTPLNPIPAGVNRQVAYYVTLPALDKYGVYNGTLTVNKVNGEAITPASIEFTQQVYTRLAQRRTVVEEYTGTGCGNCPRGWAGMEYCKENYPDTFIGIAVHQYNNSDPMYCANYGGLGLSAAPSCKINRTVQTDPYYGPDNTGIHRAVERYSAMAPSVDVTVTGFWDETKTKVDCEAQIEFLADAGKYSVAYVLTADDLTGTTPAWKQSNFYAGRANEGGALPEMPEFAEFFSGGKYAESAVLLTYNDVMIGSSYSNNKNQAASLTGSTHKAGQILTNKYTCDITVAAAGQKALDKSKIFVAALVLDADGKIVNAARARVIDVPAGVETIEVPAADAETYDLSGRRITAPAAHGISIVGGKKVIK